MNPKASPLFQGSKSSVNRAMLAHGSSPQRRARARGKPFATDPAAALSLNEARFSLKNPRFRVDFPRDHASRVEADYLPCPPLSFKLSGRGF